MCGFENPNLVNVESCNIAEFITKEYWDYFFYF
jgi:hypothetical protein